MARRVAYCETCKADREVRNVEKLPDDKQKLKLECGHTMHRIVKVADTDKVGIYDNTSWVILKDPVAEIKKAVKDNDRFKTVAYACAVLDYCGKQILVWI